jgi:phospholipid/cholesterol/gamma-HCH transport system substrate-binding protein
MARRDNALAVVAPLIKSIIVAVVGVLILGVLYVQFGQIRFNSTSTYTALFTTASGLQSASNVTANGVPVGRVDATEVDSQNHAKVTFTIDSTVRLTRGVHATIRYRNLTGDQYVNLTPGPPTAPVVPPGGTIPVTDTSPSLDLDALLGGFNPLFQGLQPVQVNQLTGELVKVMQGEGGTLNSVLAHAASFSGALADQDKVIGQVVNNLNTVTGSLDANAGQLSNTVSEAQRLVSQLARDRGDLVNGLQKTADLADQLGDLAGTLRTGHDTIKQLGRTAKIFNDNRPEFEKILSMLPGVYLRIGRVTTEGGFYNVFICSVQLRLTGADGQPYYAPQIGPSPQSRRCSNDDIAPLQITKPQGAGE